MKIIKIKTWVHEISFCIRSFFTSLDTNSNLITSVKSHVGIELFEMSLKIPN